MTTIHDIAQQLHDKTLELNLRDFYFSPETIWGFAAALLQTEDNDIEGHPDFGNPDLCNLFEQILDDYIAYMDKNDLWPEGEIKSVQIGDQIFTPEDHPEFFKTWKFVTEDEKEMMESTVH